jgi:hypothetical protein
MPVVVPNNSVIRVVAVPPAVVRVNQTTTAVLRVAAVGPQGPAGVAGALALSGNTPVPPGTPSGTVILRY